MTMAEKKPKTAYRDTLYEGAKNRRRIVQNFLLVWLDANVSTSNEDSGPTLEHLRSTVNDVNMFTEPDECISFLESIQLEKVFLIASGSLGQGIVPQVHAMTQIDAIYILCGDKSRNEEWVKKWPKVKGVFTQIKPISKALQLAVKQCDQDCASVSFASTINADDGSNVNLNQLDPSFIYTQLFKRILLSMEHNRKEAMQGLVNYCQKVYAENPAQMALIDRFGRDYQPDQAIWWYTREPFAYHMLNRALRLLEADIIVNMGFFIHDLHQQIQQLHQEQVGKYSGKPFLVYRGQGLSHMHFEKLNKNKGGLICFNYFLSTSKERDVPIMFTESSALSTDKVGVLFVITTDPKITSIPFADIQEVSYFEKEAEILFSMHAVFRIGTIQRKDYGGTYFEVDISLTKDDDVQLNNLMQHVAAETESSNKWERMGHLLMKVGQPDKAEELFNTLLEQSSNLNDRARHYHHLGLIKSDQGDHKEALSLCERSLEMYQKCLPPDHPILSNSFTNIGTMHYQMGQYSKALSFYEKAQEIRKRVLPVDDPYLANSYNNIGSVYQKTGDYTKALSFYERALVIRQKRLPTNHPFLANSYNNIGFAYDNVGDYSKALSFYERAQEIFQKSLPDNHPALATSYNLMGSAYQQTGDYTKAFSFYERALEIYQNSLPSNHAHFANSYNLMGSAYQQTGEYSKALSFYERALEINQKSISPNHPSLATSYGNIGSVYHNMGDSLKALSFYERALEINQKSLPDNHPDLASCYNNIGSVYHKRGEYSKALSCCERALQMRQKSLPFDHPDLANSYTNIGLVYGNIGEYSKALSFCEGALEIRQRIFPDNHPCLADCYNNIASAYQKTGEYAKALSFCKQALQIRQKSLPVNHPDLATSYFNIGFLYCNMGDCSNALSFYERALEIRQKTLPPNHPDLASCYNNIGSVYQETGEYRKALSFRERALEIWQQTRLGNDNDLKVLLKNTEFLKSMLTNK